MGGFDLKAYVKEQQKRGYSLDQIAGFLQSYGYSREQVYAIAGSSGPDMKLVSYIKQNLSMGYAPEQIGHYLAQYGYSKRQVNDAMASATGHTVHHIIDISTKTFVMGFMVLLALGGVGAGLFFLMNHSEPDKLLDYELRVSQYEVEPGSVLYFTNSFVNQGTEKKYDVMVDYRITNVATGYELLTKGETIEVSSLDTYAREITIPDSAQPGKYRLEGVASYDELIASSHVNFNIIKPEEEPTCSDGILNQGEEDVDCGGPCSACKVAESCFDGIRNQDEDEADCGGVCKPCPEEEETCFDGLLNQDEVQVDCGGVCDDCDEPIIKVDNKEILARVKELGTKNEAESVRLCSSMDNLRIRDECYSELAKLFSDSTYCAELESDSMLNICYMSFVQLGDYTVCDKIQDEYIRRSCESLKQINTFINSTSVAETSG